MNDTHNHPVFAALSPEAKDVIARNAPMTPDPRVAAIRAHNKVGRGSCSTIDECFTDAELVALLDADAHTTVKAAVKWAVNFDKMDRSIYAEQVAGTHW